VGVGDSSGKPRSEHSGKSNTTGFRR
jgi:hypothetical protein